MYAARLWPRAAGQCVRTFARKSRARSLVGLAKTGTSVPPELIIERFTRERLLQGGQRCFPVVSGDRLQGLVSLTDLRKLDPGQWPRASVGDIMTGVADLATIGPESDAAEALQLLAERDVNQLPVVAGGRFLGLVQRSDLVAWIGLKLDRFAGSEG